MKHLLVYIFSLCLVLQFSAFAQEEQEKNTQDSVDVDKKAVLSALSFSFDYGKFLAGFILDTEEKYEGGLQIEFFDKVFLVGEYGFATLTPDDAYINGNYISEGSYWRAGLGYKFNMDQKYNFYISGRYAQADYYDEGKVEIYSETGIYDPFIMPFKRESEKAQWIELVASSERRVWKGFYTGFHIRLRVMLEYGEKEPLDIFSIPGYGRTFDKALPALNLYIKYNLEFFE